MSDTNRYRRVATSMAQRYGVDPEIFIRLIEKKVSLILLPKVQEASLD